MNVDPAEKIPSRDGMMALLAAILHTMVNASYVVLRALLLSCVGCDVQRRRPSLQQPEVDMSANPPSWTLAYANASFYMQTNATAAS